MPNWCNNMLEITGSPEAVARAKKLVCFENEGQYKVDFEILAPMPEALNGINEIFFDDIDFPNYRIPKYHRGRLGLSSFKELKDEMVGRGLSEDFKSDEIIAQAKELPLYKDDMAIEEFAEQIVRTCTKCEEVPKVVRTILQMLKDDNALYCMAKYGHSNWYTWSNCNWGTKWNVEYESYLITDDAHDFSVGFDTAWDEPDSWFASLVSELERNNINVDAYLTYGEGGMWFGGKHIYQDGIYWKEEMGHDELKEFLGIEDEDFEGL